MKKRLYLIPVFIYTFFVFPLCSERVDKKNVKSLIFRKKKVNLGADYKNYTNFECYEKESVCAACDDLVNVLYG